MFHMRVHMRALQHKQEELIAFSTTVLYVGAIQYRDLGCSSLTLSSWTLARQLAAAVRPAVCLLVQAFTDQREIKRFVIYTLSVAHCGEVDAQRSEHELRQHLQFVGVQRTSGPAHQRSSTLSA